MNALLRALNIAFEEKDREIATLRETNIELRKANHKLVEENIELGNRIKTHQNCCDTHGKCPAPLPELGI